MPVLDYFGFEIKGGQTVVYPVRHGSSMWLNHLRVSQVGEDAKGLYVTGYNDSGRRVTIRNNETCVILEALQRA